MFNKEKFTQIEDSPRTELIASNYLSSECDLLSGFMKLKNTRRQLFRSENIRNVITNKQDALANSKIPTGDGEGHNSNLIASLEEEEETGHFRVRRSSILYNESNRRPSSVQAVQSSSSIDPMIIAEYLKRTEENSAYTSYKRKTRLIDLFIFFLVVGNIAFSIIDNEVYIAYSDVYLQDYMTLNNLAVFNLEILTYMSTRTLTHEENLFRFINSFCSVLTCVLLVIRYRIEMKLLQIDDKLSKYDTMFSSGIIWYLLVEIVICIIFYPPFLNYVLSGEMLGLLYVYNLNSIFSIIVMMKIYVSLRVVTNTSRWNSGTANAICHKYHVRSGIRFTVKAEMKKRPAIVLTFLLLASLALLGFSLRTFEYGIISPATIALKGNNDLSYIANCFWLVIVTMTTVGYGDYFPRSHLGRFVGVITCIIGMLLLSLIVVSFSVVSEFTGEEKLAFTKLKTLMTVSNIENKAANVIKNIILMRKLSDLKKKVSERFIIFTKLKRQLTIFRDNTKAASYSIPLDEMLQRLSEKVASDVDTLAKNIGKIQNLDKEFASLMKAQESDRLRLDKIISMQGEIGAYLVRLNNVNVRGGKVTDTQSDSVFRDVRGVVSLTEDINISFDDDEHEESSFTVPGEMEL
jgi:hypothetical protein